MEYREDIRETADRIDLLDFLSSRAGMRFRKTGLNRYQWLEHDSFVVIPYGEKAGWHWNSRGLHGRNALDYLIKVENLSFKEAARIIRGERPVYEPVQKKENKQETVTEEITKKEDLVIPARAPSARQAVQYLSGVRGIDKRIIFDLIKRGRIYMDTSFNCVFVNFDREGEISFVQKRSLREKKIRSYGGKDRGGYGFSLEGKKDDGRVYVYEAPIDMLSHACMYALDMNDMSRWDDLSRIALCGVSSSQALDYYLDCHDEVKEIVFCLDNDEAGMRHTVKYILKYAGKGYSCAYITPSNKDFNEDLMMEREKEMSYEDFEKMLEKAEKENEMGIEGR